MRPASSCAWSRRPLAGVAFRPGESRLRRIRLTALFADPPPLSYFDPDALRAMPGWDEAFEPTIVELEQAGLGPGDLPTDGDPRWRDVADIWRAVAEAACTSWTAARILDEAARLLEEDPAAWPFPGPVLAPFTGTESAVLCRYLAAVPGATRRYLAARPQPERLVERVEALLTRAEAAAIRDAVPPAAGTTERDLLAAHLFDHPDRLADPKRPRSDGPDGTVHLELHAGVVDEVEATADQVARQVLERGRRLGRIAVLMPPDEIAQRAR